MLVILALMWFLGGDETAGFCYRHGLRQRNPKTRNGVSKPVLLSKVGWKVLSINCAGAGSSSSLNSANNDSGVQDDSTSLPVDEVSNGRQASLLDLLSPIESCKVDRMSGTDLAYIGDSVFELFIRSKCVWPSKRTSDLQHQVVGLVRAEKQSELLERLKNEFELTEKEGQVLMRGRNAVTKSKNNRRKNPVAYQDSTAFEALIGYMYISNPERCQELLVWLESVL